jgi:hypothetical protein
MICSNVLVGQVFLHPSCVDHQNEAALDSRMLVYYELVKTAKVSPTTLWLPAVCASADSRITHGLDFLAALAKVRAKEL